MQPRDRQHFFINPNETLPKQKLSGGSRQETDKVRMGLNPDILFLKTTFSNIICNLIRNVNKCK